MRGGVLPTLPHCSQCFRGLTLSLVEDARSAAVKERCSLPDRGLTETGLYIVSATFLVVGDHLGLLDSRFIRLSTPRFDLRPDVLMSGRNTWGSADLDYRFCAI
jgi:hypothetical protein